MSLTERDLLCYRDHAVSQTPLADPKRCMDAYLQRTAFSDLGLVLVGKLIDERASRCGEGRRNQTQGLSITRWLGILPVLMTLKEPIAQAFLHSFRSTR
jgi:hypothetical protein